MYITYIQWFAKLLTCYLSQREKTPVRGFFWKRTILWNVIHAILHCKARWTKSIESFFHNIAIVVLSLLRRSISLTPLMVALNFPTYQRAVIYFIWGRPDCLQFDLNQNDRTLAKKFVIRRSWYCNVADDCAINTSKKYYKKYLHTLRIFLQ